MVCLGKKDFDLIYGTEFLSDLRDRVRLIDEPFTADALHEHAIRDAEFMFSGWQCPRLDKRALNAMPALKMVFYGAGSIRRLMTEEAWDRGIRVCSSYAANAVPVAEMTMSQIVFCLKHGYRQIREYQTARSRPTRLDLPGAYESTVGIVSLGMIGSMVCERLKSMDVDVVAYDPFATPEKAASLGVRLVDLPDLFAASDVVSIHTPSLEATRGLVTGELIGSMKPHASLINTSRGAVIDQPAMVSALKRRTDLTAVLDVTENEPEPPDSALWDMENAILLPHIAGSIGPECRRMGRYMLDELDRHLAGQPLRWEITREAFAIMA